MKQSRQIVASLCNNASRQNWGFTAIYFLINAQATVGCSLPQKQLLSNKLLGQ